MLRHGLPRRRPSAENGCPVQKQCAVARGTHPDAIDATVVGEGLLLEHRVGVGVLDVLILHFFVLVICAHAERRERHAHTAT